MNENKIIKQRGEIINAFINIEWLINAIISQWYLGRVEKEFVLEVLFNEYFSFALKRKIIEKIFSKRCNSKLAPGLKEMLDSLGRLSNIRNCFAHCSDRITLSDFQGEYIPNPKNYDVALKFDDLHREFMKKEKEVNRYFYDLYVSIGGKATINKRKKTRKLHAD